MFKGIPKMNKQGSGGRFSQIFVVGVSTLFSLKEIKWVQFQNTQFRTFALHLEKTWQIVL